MRIGHGYDVHKFGEGRALVLGGVHIPHTMGLMGHSDADVLTHAVCDALLGAAGEGDIGIHFPDTNPAYKGICSLALLTVVIRIIRTKGFVVGNIDATVIAQAPKLAPFIPQMREQLAKSCGVAADVVNIKATTEEGLGFTGERLGIAAHAVVLLENDTEGRC